MFKYNLIYQSKQFFKANNAYIYYNIVFNKHKSMYVNQKQ